MNVILPYAKLASFTYHWSLKYPCNLARSLSFTDRDTAGHLMHANAVGPTPILKPQDW